MLGANIGYWGVVVLQQMLTDNNQARRNWDMCLLTLAAPAAYYTYKFMTSVEKNSLKDKATHTDATTVVPQ